MKAQLSFTSRPILLVMTIAILIFLLSQIWQQQITVKSQESVVDMRAAATSVLNILSGSEDCLAVTTPATKSVYAHIADREKLDGFQKIYAKTEPECARNFQYGYRAVVEELPTGSEACGNTSSLQRPGNALQIIMVIDTSGSMADDVADLSRLPSLLQNLKNQGIDINVTAYLLPAAAPVTMAFDCTSTGFASTDFTCETLQGCSLVGEIHEDWGNGLGCAIAKGPAGGWKPDAARLAVIMSDEPSAGDCIDIVSHTCSLDSPSCINSNASFANGLRAALDSRIKVYGLEAGAGAGNPCTPLVGTMLEEISSKTGGKHIRLSNPEEAARSIADIATEQVTNSEPAECMSWSFGAAEFSPSISIRDRVKKSLPIGIKSSPTEIRVGRITIDMTDGDLERLSGFLDESCILGKQGSVVRRRSMTISLPASFEQAGNTSMACIEAGKKACKPLLCETAVQRLAPGSYIISTEYSSGRLTVNA